jgi:hypothetical protein
LFVCFFFYRVPLSNKTTLETALTNSLGKIEFKGQNKYPCESFGPQDCEKVCGDIKNEEKKERKRIELFFLLFN